MVNLISSGMIDYMQDAYDLERSISEKDTERLFTIAELHDYSHLRVVTVPTSKPASLEPLLDSLETLAQRVSWLRQEIIFHKVAISFALTYQYYDRYTMELQFAGELTAPRDYWAAKIKHDIPDTVKETLDREPMVLTGSWLDSDGWVGRPLSVPPSMGIQEEPELSDEDVNMDDDLVCSPCLQLF